MIRYTLRCAEGHQFESWFQSAAAFDTLAAAGHLSCAECGSGEVEKSLMAPSLAGEDTDEARARPLSTPRTPVERAIAALRTHVERTSDYVGRDFAREARAMHEGEVPDRPIWGEARIDEARALAEDGVPVAPLPFRRRRDGN